MIRQSRFGDFAAIVCRVASVAVETVQLFGYFLSLSLSLGRTSWLNQPLQPDTCEITQHLVFVLPLWKQSLQGVTSSHFYGLTHVRAMRLDRSALCPAKFY